MTKDETTLLSALHTLISDVFQDDMVLIISNNVDINSNHIDNPDFNLWKYAVRKITIPCTGSRYLDSLLIAALELRIRVYCFCTKELTHEWNMLDNEAIYIFTMEKLDANSFKNIIDSIGNKILTMTSCFKIFKDNISDDYDCIKADFNNIFWDIKNNTCGFSENYIAFNRNITGLKRLREQVKNFQHSIEELEEVQKGLLEGMSDEEKLLIETNSINGENV